MQQIPGIGGNFFEALFLLLIDRPVHSIHQQIGVADDGVHGSAELMRHVGQEGGLQLVELAQLTVGLFQQIDQPGSLLEQTVLSGNFLFQRLSCRRNASHHVVEGAPKHADFILRFGDYGHLGVTFGKSSGFTRQLLNRMADESVDNERGDQNDQQDSQHGQQDGAVPLGGDGLIGALHAHADRHAAEDFSRSAVTMVAIRLIQDWVKIDNMPGTQYFVLKNLIRFDTAF